MTKHILYYLLTHESEEFSGNSSLSSPGASVSEWIESEVGKLFCIEQFSFAISLTLSAIGTLLLIDWKKW